MATIAPINIGAERSFLMHSMLTFFCGKVTVFEKER